MAKSKSQPPQPFERFRLKLHEIIINNFIGGAFWALGATIGLALIIAILTLIAQNVDFDLIPVVGEFVANIVDFVLSKNSNSQR